MNSTQKALALAISGAFVATIAATNVSAAQNPFALKSLGTGYMVAENDKMKDGKCGTGKCGANKAKAKAAEKTAEGSCHGDKSMDKDKEMACSADKMKDGSCSADKAKEANCSASKAKEASCSANKAKEASCHAEKAK